MTTPPRPDNLTATAAVTRLKAGNQRYIEERQTPPLSVRARRLELLNTQCPFATVITCSDSRVPPELIFAQDPGNLFVVRVAGNICDDAVLGTVEYGALHLGINLVVVMGHRNCGAVAATVDNLDLAGPATHNHIDTLIDAIRPALDHIDADSKAAFVDAGVRENAHHVAIQIRNSTPVMDELAAAGVLVAATYYDLEDGVVSWL